MSGAVVVALIGIPSTIIAALATIITADRIAERRHSVPCSLCSLPTGRPYPIDGHYRPVRCDVCKPQLECRLALVAALDARHTEEPT